MKEVIAEAVYEALQRVHVVTDADREAYREAYGHPVEEGDDMADYPGIDYDDAEDVEDEDWDDEDYAGWGEIPADYEPMAPVLGYEVGGENADLAALISEALLTDGQVKQAEGKKVYDIVLGALNDFPKKVINGREQNYFVGSPDQFADIVAGKIEEGLASKGILGKIKSFLKLRK